MFHKTRKEIVLAIMGALLLLLLITLAVIYGASYWEIRKQSTEMLERYAEIFSLDAQPGQWLPSEEPTLEPPERESTAFQLSTFYSAAISDTGELLALDNGRAGIYTAAEIEETARSLLAGGRSRGTYGSLLYLLTEKDGYTLVSFMDNTVTSSSMRTLLRYTLLGGAAAMLLILALSFGLARRIVQPLEENDRRQKQFISDAGHELKTPVAILETNAELLSRQTGENEWLSNIRYETERMGALVTQLLDLSHAESAETPKEPLDLSRLVMGETLPFESVAFEKGMAIETDIAPDIEVTGNATQLRQLTSILLDNAIRHSDGREAVSLTLRREHNRVLLSVSNSGPELTADQQSHLFDRFYRADEVRNGEERHYGLGLPIAKAIAEAHRGSIHVEYSDPRITFTVTFLEK